MPKFKVGETVRMKAEPKVKLFILETVVQTCYADCEQEWYTGRTLREGFGKEHDVGKVEKFSLIELEAIPEESPRVKKMRKELEKLNKKKTHQNSV